MPIFALRPLEPLPDFNSSLPVDVSDPRLISAVPWGGPPATPPRPIVVGDSGLGITPGGNPVPVDPWGPIAPERMDALRALALGHAASKINDPEMRRRFEAAEVAALDHANERLRNRLSGANRPKR